MKGTKAFKTRSIGLLLAIIMLLQILMPTLSVLAAEGLTDIEFADKNLYNKVKKELEGKPELTVKYYNDEDLVIQVANEDIAKITELNLQGSKNKQDDVVKNLTGLEKFTSLQKLHLAQNKLTSDANLGVLNELSNLKELDLSENKIEDVSSIPNLLEASKNGNLMLKLTGQYISYVEIVNKIPEDQDFDLTTKIKAPQIFSYAYSKGETVEVIGANAERYVENGEVYLELGIDNPLYNETKVGYVPSVKVQVTGTADGQEGSTFNTVCDFKYIVIDGENYEGIVFHEEGNLYYAVKEEIAGIDGKEAVGKNKDGKEYKDIIDENNKYFDTEKVMVINKIDLYRDITLLDASGSGVNYLKGINHFVGLQDLLLNDNYIQDVTLLKSLVENKNGSMSDALSSRISDFKTEYSELVKVYSSYEAKMQRKNELEILLDDPDEIDNYDKYKMELDNIEVSIEEKMEDIKEYAKSSISELSEINKYISLDEIIGFKNDIDKLEEEIEKLENGLSTTEELDAIKTEISNIYASVTGNIKNLTREELGYLTDDEYQAYLSNKVDELSEQELREVLSAVDYELRGVTYEIYLPEDTYGLFNIRLEPSEEIETIMPIIETDYSKAYVEEEGYTIYAINVDNPDYEYASGTKVGKVTFIVPEEISLSDATMKAYFTGMDEDGDEISEREITSSTYLKRSTLSTSTSSSSKDYSSYTKEELIEACKSIISGADTEDELNDLEAIIRVVEAKNEDISNIRYYDSHEIIYDLRVALEDIYSETELRAFANIYGITLPEGLEGIDEVKLEIIEILETYSKDKLIEILKEENLRRKFVDDFTTTYSVNGIELIKLLANNNAENNLINLLSKREKENYKKYALIDAIMKEVNEYKTENIDDVYDDVDARNRTYKDSDGNYIAYDKLSDEQKRNLINVKLVDDYDVDELTTLANDMRTSYGTKYITSKITEERIYDMALDFAMEVDVIDDEGNVSTQNITIADRIAEIINEEIEEIDDFGMYDTYVSAKALLNYIEPVASKSRYLVPYLNSLDIDSIDVSKLSTVKLKLDKISARLDANISNTIPKLEVLNLAQNSMLNNVEPLATLTTLKILNLANNYMIDDITKLNINTFADLEILNLARTGLTDFSISGLRKLRCLDLSYNYLENINNVQIIGDGENPPFYTDNLNNLIHLNLSGNRIADIENIVNELNNLTRYQSSRSMLMKVPFDINRDLMLYSQKLFANMSVTNSGREKIIDLPMIYRQIEELQGITVRFGGDKGNVSNNGKQMALPTYGLGDFTETAEIVGGIGAGTIYTVNYTVKDKEEASKVPVTSILIQEEIVLGNENASMPDLTEDKKVTTADVDKIVEYIGKEEFPVVADVVPDGIINDSDYKLLKEYVKEGWNSDNLTLEQRQKASEADINADNNVDNKDLEILALHILNVTSNSSTSIADINADGIIDIKDANMLSKYIVSKSTERRNTDVVTLAILNEYKETKQLHANVMPENATDKRVTWTSNNENYVKIDETGKLTAVGEGTTTINVASVSDTNVFKTIRVDVVKAENIVEEINIVEPKEGETGIKTDYYVGEALDLANAKLEAKRRDGTKEIVDITKEMLEGFTTEEVGEKLVTVTYEGKQTSFTINVTEYNEPKVDIIIDDLDVKLPENVVYDGQEHLAEVAIKEGVKAGELSVSYKDEAGNDIEKPVNAGIYKVIANITDSIFANPAEIEVGTFEIAKAELPAEVRPSIPTEYTVEKDGNFTVAVENGTITIPEGTTFDEVGTKDVTLTFVPNDANYAAITIPVKVNVIVSVTGVNLNKSEYIVVKGGTVSLVATVMPEDATNKNVVWSSSDENIAKVENGKITAVEVGEATITVTTKDGGKSTTCKVIVKEQVYGAKELKDGTVAITGINPDTTEEYFRNKFLSENTYKIFKTDGKTELSKTDTIATGYKLKVYDENGTVVEEQLLVVKGDTNGDGKASATDSGNILAHRTGEKILENEYLLAADINNDGTVDGRDSTLLIYHRIGMIGYILQNN